MVPPKLQQMTSSTTISMYFLTALAFFVPSLYAAAQQCEQPDTFVTKKAGVSAPTEENLIYGTHKQMQSIEAEEDYIMWMFALLMQPQSSLPCDELHMEVWDKELSTLYTSCVVMVTSQADHGRFQWRSADSLTDQNFSMEKGKQYILVLSSPNSTAENPWRVHQNKDVYPYGVNLNSPDKDLSICFFYECKSSDNRSKWMTIGPPGNESGQVFPSQMQGSYTHRLVIPPAKEYARWWKCFH